MIEGERGRKIKRGEEERGTEGKKEREGERKR
jgi:hypothetical protein